MPPADRARALSAPDALLTAASGACLAAHFAAWVGSLKATSLAHSLLLVCMAPVVLVIWALLRRQPISWGEIVGTLLALAGAPPPPHLGWGSGCRGAGVAEAGPAAPYRVCACASRSKPRVLPGPGQQRGTSGRRTRLCCFRMRRP